MKIDLRIINTILWVISLVVFVSLTIYVSEMAREVNEKIYADNENIDWYFDCSSQFISAHYNCEHPFQNLTGKYCGDKIVCENSYKLKGNQK